MAMFNSYVKLPEGMSLRSNGAKNQELSLGSLRGPGFQEMTNKFSDLRVRLVPFSC